MAHDDRRVRPERSGWRDEAISRRHREWGFDVPAVDVDFLLCEYDRATPRALIDYKHERAAPTEMTSANMTALRRLAEDRDYELPAFVVRYTDDLAWYTVVPVNDHGRRALRRWAMVRGGPEEPEAAHGSLRMAERDFVAFLVYIRRSARQSWREVAGAT